MIKKSYLAYVHNLRGLAIFVIVIIHTRMAAFGGDEDIGANKILMILLENGTIIFVFISGFLFQHVFTSNLKYKKYLLNKLRFVLLPYLLASVLPIIDKLYFDNNIPWMTPELESLSNFQLLGYMLITGKHFGPYWFIPMITIFYLLAPVLVKLNNRRFYLYIFPLIFLAGLFTYQFGYRSTILDSFVYFFPIYLLGMFASYYRAILFNWQRIILSTLLAIYVIFFIMEINEILVTPKLMDFDRDSVAYLVFSPAKLRFSVLAVMLLIIFKKYENNKNKVFAVLGDYSFGIYFIHLYFVILYLKIVPLFEGTIQSEMISFVLATGFTILLSVLFVWFVKLIFKENSRYIIGS